MGKFPIQIISLGKQIEFLGNRMEFVESPIQGDTYFSIFRGSGLEFKGHREYSMQDDSSDIDWKASSCKRILSRKGNGCCFPL